ncbi:MAG: ERAP1-like C-terminal domain-containing protein [Candidatus Saccharibacteria bacterium]
MVQKELKRLGLVAKKTDSHFDKLLRPTILGMAAMADEPSVLEEAKRLFYSGKTDTIDPDLRGVVYTTIARHGDEEDF